MSKDLARAVEAGRDALKSKERKMAAFAKPRGGADELFKRAIADTKETLKKKKNVIEALKGN